MNALPSIEAIRRSDHRLWVAREFRAALDSLGFGESGAFRAALDRSRSVPGGRGPHRLLALPGSDARLRLRPARHGGIFGSLLGGRFLSPARAPRELALWLELRGRGIALPTPVAAIASRRAGFWSCYFAALERDGAQDGLAWLVSAPEPARLDRGVVAVARALRRLHDAGVVHGDLNLRNLLVEERAGDSVCLFVDLDHARTQDIVPPRDRLAELARLARSIEKHDLAAGIDLRLRARFVQAYCDGNRAMRRSLLASQSSERHRLARHRFAWRAYRRMLSVRSAPPNSSA